MLVMLIFAKGTITGLFLAVLVATFCRYIRTSTTTVPRSNTPQLRTTSLHRGVGSRTDTALAPAARGERQQVSGFRV